jgi:hypothetical protein
MAYCCRVLPFWKKANVSDHFVELCSLFCVIDKHLPCVFCDIFHNFIFYFCKFLPLSIKGPL